MDASLDATLQTRENLIDSTGMGYIATKCLDDALAKTPLEDIAYPHWSDPRALVQVNK